MKMKTLATITTVMTAFSTTVFPQGRTTKIINISDFFPGIKDGPIASHYDLPTPAWRKFNVRINEVMVNPSNEDSAEFVDFFWLGDDFSTQRGMMISPKLWRTFLKPVYK